CPIVGVSGGRNSAPSLVSVGGIVPHHWCQGGGEIVSHRWCQWGGGIVPHHWCQWGGIVPHHWCQCGGGEN
ncbi:unnamed protein product, partial [Staurois parvus]